MQARPVQELTRGWAAFSVALRKSTTMIERALS
jgi:hypothetical protein